MNVWALANPLTGLLTCSNLCASTTACCPRFVLNTSTNGQSLFTGDLRLLFVRADKSAVCTKELICAPQAPYFVWRPLRISQDLANAPLRSNVEYDIDYDDGETNQAESE